MIFTAHNSGLAPCRKGFFEMTKSSNDDAASKPTIVMAINIKLNIN